jgi:RNA polymerase sigma-70 factor (ECF subfamily)
MNGDILVERTLAGDHQAFNSLITDYYTDIYGMILSWVKNPEDAKDLTQDVFISAYLDLSSLRDRERFYSWLRQIARHKCQSWKRKQIDFVPLHDDLISKEPSTDEVLILRETLAKVMEAIDSLPESEKRLLKEHYLDNVSYDELEARHGVSAKALVVRLVRTRRKIRDQLEKTLSAFVAFLHDHTESILTGGMEIVKLGVKTKLIAGGIAIILILGGAGVLVDRHYVQNRSKRETLQTSQENYSKSPAKSVSDAKRSSMNDKGHSNKKVVTQVKMQVNEPEVSKEKTENLQPKVASGTETSKTDASKKAISPELEETFYSIKSYLDKVKAIRELQKPYSDRLDELNAKIDTISKAINNEGTSSEERNRLIGEDQQLTKESQEFAIPYNQLYAQREQVLKELDEYTQAHYGIPYQQFMDTDTYREIFRPWLMAQWGLIPNAK